MWTAIFLAQDEMSAIEVKNKFITNNILIKIKPIFNEENKKHCYEFYVPYSELNTALDLIIDMQE